jgi:hypothetical protein
VSSLTFKPLSQTRWESQIESLKAIKFQTPKIRDVLLQLAKTSENPKTKSKANCLATYEIESFEFLLSMIIWYDILFAVNTVNKSLQSKDTHIDVAIDQLESLISYFKTYKEIGKRIIRRNKQFDENAMMRQHNLLKNILELITSYI